MRSSESDIQSCAECGASVYPEHVESGKAAVIDDRLRCPHCLVDYKKTHHTDEPRFVGQATMRAPGEADDFTPISIDKCSSPKETAVEISTIGGESFAGAAALHDESHLKRRLITGAPNATRCRTFHAKLNDGAVGYLNKHVNDWADDNPDVEIKFASSTIGVWEGKKADPHLIVTVFY